MSSQRVSFNNKKGIRLSGIMEWPDQKAGSDFFAIFTHCFTCSKDLKAIVRVSRRLAVHGIAVLRFDFTGLGDSQGDFSETNFSTNLEDIDAAVSFLNSNHQAPQLLIGHSLGGAAMMVRSGEIDSAKAVVTIAAPSSTTHLAEYLSSSNPLIESAGEGTVEIGGRRWNLRRQLIENLRGVDLPTAVEAMRLPHLILHPPDDQTLPYWHAEQLFQMTGGTKAMVTLDGADHLLVEQPGDVDFVADLISLWSNRYVKH